MSKTKTSAKSVNLADYKKSVMAEKAKDPGAFNKKYGKTPPRVQGGK